ncbi:DUF4912 domain-containing protein [Elusimicrobium minutum]|uniref:DUF4912 domain-containing protein n=1 Tax=Elusimicrobium minutum TaxID=423605 RepID=UPI0001617E28|nr:DUF4912 domain-containing protein [Elusimicrobium minutum]
MDTRNYNSTSFIKVENKEKKEAELQLPSGYGKTEAFLLPKDPAWMFLFWEITGSTYDYIKSQNGFDIFDKAKQIVRLHDTTDVNFDGFNSNGYSDVQIAFSSNSWYLAVPNPGRCYTADLGLLSLEGKFILIARSNPVTVPSGRISDVIDEKWMVVEGDFQKMLAMSGAQYIGMGASELSHMISERLKYLTSLPSSYMSSNKSSKEFFQNTVSEDEDIWLKADCEIIIYGSASPGCTVKINGKEIELKNGSFSIRQSLQKGDMVNLPITAEKGKNKRSLKIKAERED